MERVEISFINRISQTSLLTLAARAKESQEKQPLIVDTKACELLHTIDYDFEKFNNKLAQVVISLRSHYFDKKVIEFITHNAHPVVISVGCGLDTRYDRIGPIAEQASFYHIDLPEVIEIRERLLLPKANERYLSDSILNSEWMEDIKKENPYGNFIFIVEGVFIYFNKETCLEFLRNVSNKFGKGLILFDVFNSAGLLCNFINGTLKNTEAKFNSAFNNIDTIERHCKNVKLQKAISFNELPGFIRMGKCPRLLMYLFPPFKNFYRLLAYRITTAQ